MKNQITVIDDGTTQNVELISYFEVTNTGKRYLFYTLNEKVESGLVKMYAACATNVGNTFTVQNSMTDEEWTNLKSIMKTILTGGNDPSIKYIYVD